MLRTITRDYKINIIIIITIIIDTIISKIYSYLPYVGKLETAWQSQCLNSAACDVPQRCG